MAKSNRSSKPAPVAEVTPAPAGESTPDRPMLPPALGVLPLQYITDLGPDQSVTLAKVCDDSQRAAYLTIAKVMVSLRDHQFEGGVPLATKLREAGIRKTTIDNARRVHHTYLHLVSDGFMPEEDFDRLMGHPECVSVNAVMNTQQSKRAFTAKEAATFILANPDSFSDEFDSFAAYGMSVADKVKVDAAPKVKPTAAATPAAPAVSTAPATPAATTTATVSTTTPPTVPPPVVADATAAPVPPVAGNIVPLPPQTAAKPVTLPEGASKLVAAMNDLIGECEDVATLRTLAQALTCLAGVAADKADDAELAALDAQQAATVG